MATITPHEDIDSLYKEKMVNFKVKILQETTFMADRDTLLFKIPFKVIKEYFENGVGNLPLWMKISAMLSEEPEEALQEPTFDDLDLYLQFRQAKRKKHKLGNYTGDRIVFVVSSQKNISKIEKKYVSLQKGKKSKNSKETFKTDLSRKNISARKEKHFYYEFVLEEKNYSSRLNFFKIYFFICLGLMFHGIRKIMDKFKEETAQQAHANPSSFINQFCVYAASIDHCVFFALMSFFNHVLPSASGVLFPFVVVAFMNIVVTLNIVYHNRANIRGKKMFFILLAATLS